MSVLRVRCDKASRQPKVSPELDEAAPEGAGGPELAQRGRHPHAAGAASPAESWRRTRGFLEFPEDLGQCKFGMPASIWEAVRARELPESYLRVAICQCYLADVDYSKPTGLLSFVLYSSLLLLLRTPCARPLLLSTLDARFAFSGNLDPGGRGVNF